MQYRLNKLNSRKSVFFNSTIFCHNCLFFILVGEPITVPKIENPTEAMVDLYHGMYLRSLLSLFDKYKTRFGLKESDVLHIQWEDEQLFKPWTVPVAGLSLDCEAVHLQTVAKEPSASTQHKRSSRSGSLHHSPLTAGLAWTKWHHLFCWNLYLVFFFPKRQHLSWG